MPLAALCLPHPLTTPHHSPPLRTTVPPPRPRFVGVYELCGPKDPNDKALPPEHAGQGPQEIPGSITITPQQARSHPIAVAIAVAIAISISHPAPHPQPQSLASPPNLISVSTPRHSSATCAVPSAHRRWVRPSGQRRMRAQCLRSPTQPVLRTLLHRQHPRVTTLSSRSVHDLRWYRGGVGRNSPNANGIRWPAVWCGVRRVGMRESDLEWDGLGCRRRVGSRWGARRAGYCTYTVRTT